MQKHNIQILVTVWVVYSIFNCDAQWFNRNAAREGGLTTVQIAEKYGYPIKEHVVITNDDSKLRLYRIPHGRGNEPRDDEPPRPPVLLMHGIVNSSDIWIMMGPEKGLGFILADEYFDVWLGDFRGSRYSNDLNDYSNENYWNSSFNEMGINDYPAFINRIEFLKEAERNTKNRRKQKVIVISHSMGTTAYYALASKEPTYVLNHVEVMISFAPVAYMTGAGNAFFKNVIGIFANLMMKIGVHGLDGRLTRGVGKWLALEKVIMQRIFKYGIFVVSGHNHEQLDMTTLPIITGHVPSGFTTKTLLHYKQLADSDEFREYDYGIEKNREVYQQDTPRDYKLENNPVPIILYYGLNDKISPVPNVRKLVDRLNQGKAKVELIQVNNANFNHMDFVFAKDVVELLYKPLIAKIKICVEKYKIVNVMITNDI